MSAEVILFWIFAVLTVGCAVGVILSKNPIGSAMFLVGSFFFLAGLYVLLLAHTIAVIQVLVYAGAIMVLFLFVIMLLSLTDTGMGKDRITPGRIIGGVSALALLFTLVVALSRVAPEQGIINEPELRTFGTLAALGQILYTQWLFPFEAVSLLLLVAMVGAVVVAKSRI